MGQFNNREIASAIWLLVLLGFAISHPESRRSIVSVLRRFFHWKIVGSVCAMMVRDFAVKYSVQNDADEKPSRTRQSRRAAKARGSHAQQRDIERLSSVVNCLSLLVLNKYDRNVGGSTTDELSNEVDIPEFETEAEMDAWWESLPKVRADVDPRLLEKVKTSIRLSRKTIDGFDYLAKKMGLRSGQTLMKVVLGNYLSDNLPPDF